MAGPAPILFCFAVEEEARPFRPRTHSPILVTGMGARNARRAFKEKLETLEPAAVFTCGFAGGLNPELESGAVLYSCPKEFPFAKALTNAGARAGKFHCVERVLVTPGEKAAARKETGTEAVEMESGVIREICTERGIPCATVRVISDAADEELPLDFNQLMDEEMRLGRGALAWALLWKPWRLPRLARLGRRVKFAAGRLAEVLAAAERAG